MGEPVASGYREYPGDPETPEDSEDSEPESRTWLHHFNVSPDCVPHMEKVFSIVRQTYGRSPTNDLNDLDVNTAVWVYFMSVALQAAGHLGQDSSENLRSIKNRPLKSVKQLFRTTEKLIKDQVEMTGLSTIDWNQPIWRESCLLCDRAVQIMKSQTYVFSDSVLRLGDISTAPLQAWKDKIKWYISKVWIESAGSRWNSSGKFSQDSLHRQFSLRFKRRWRY